MILILIGVLASMTPGANAYIDFNNLERTATGMVWLKLIIATLRVVNWRLYKEIPR